MRSPKALVTLKLFLKQFRCPGATALKTFSGSCQSPYLLAASSMSVLSLPRPPPPFLIGNNPKVKKSNMTRECIRYFFPVRRCFVFDRPTSDKNLLLQIEKVPENQLEWNFQVESKKFCSYIFSNAKTKTLRGGIIVTGNREFLLSQECLCGFEYVMK